MRVRISQTLDWVKDTLRTTAPSPYPLRPLPSSELEVNRFWVQDSPFHGEYFLRDGALARMTFPGEDPAEVLAAGTKGEGCLLMHVVYHIFFRRESCEHALHVICEKK